MRTDFIPDPTTPAQLSAAIRLLVADFDGRPTTRVVGTGGRAFEFFPTAITDNIPPLQPSVDIYLNGVTVSDRIILIDDLISTGGTLVSLVQAIRQTGAEILEIFTIGEKSENHGREHLFRETGFNVKTLLHSSLETRDGKVFSKVDQVHLGRMPEPLMEEVAKDFPAGFSVSGSGGGVRSI